jgi:hypothetical protein
MTSARNGCQNDSNVREVKMSLILVPFWPKALSTWSAILDTMEMTAEFKKYIWGSLPSGYRFIRAQHPFVLFAFYWLASRKSCFKLLCYIIFSLPFNHWSFVWVTFCLLDILIITCFIMVIRWKMGKKSFNINRWVNTAQLKWVQQPTWNNRGHTCSKLTSFFELSAIWKRKLACRTLY